ncbi:MAG: hypothetical protein ACRD0X_06565 [Thermoanaerobaculia bacterium]
MGKRRQPVAKDDPKPGQLDRSPLIGDLERAIADVHEGRWRRAVGALEELLERTDLPELATTARRYLAICRERLSGPPADEAEDPYLAAVIERNRGHLAEAQALCAAGGRRGKDPRFAYLAASLFALGERYDEAARYLEVAETLDPAARVHAQLDADFLAMRAQPAYRHLF